MEISSYSAVTINTKMIPGKLLGIIFSKSFENAYKQITGNKMPDDFTIRQRFAFLRSIRIISDVYIYTSEDSSPKFYDEYYEQLIIYTEEIFNSSEVDGYPGDPIEIWECIYGKGHVSLRNLMRKVTSVLWNVFMNYNDIPSIEGWAESIEIDPESEDPEIFEIMKIFREREAYINNMLYNFKNKDLERLVSNVKKSDPRGYEIYKKYEKYLSQVSELPTRLFRPIEDEIQNGAIDIEMLIFHIVDEKYSFWYNCIESDQETADMQGVTNTCNFIALSESHELSDDYNKRKLLVDKKIEIFERMKDFYNEVKKHIKNETK